MSDFADDPLFPDRTRPALSRRHCRRRAPRRFPGYSLRVAATSLALGMAALSPHAVSRAEARTEAAAFGSASAVRDEIQKRAGSDLRAFYAMRGNRPLWLDASGRFSPAATLLLGQVRTARLDGVKPGKVKADALAKALDRARSGKPEDVARAEIQLSKTYVAWVKALRTARRADMIYESDALKPVAPTTTAALQAAAGAPSLERQIAEMRWMNPLYAPMREALADPSLDDASRRMIARNLDRIRALPAIPSGRFVLVDAAGARLWMYQNGRVVDSMRVVVGKPVLQTPMMAGFLRYAIVNPYWNVPPDLVRDRIAANVLAKGIGYLEAGGYQVLSDWSDHPAVVDPGTIDWHAVATGAPPPRVRQLPGGENFMGRVKFVFPNEQGIYLHDTPDMQLMQEQARQLSSGCVRLQDAARFGRWLMRKPLPKSARTPEQQIELAEPVPLFITYLTAMPENGRIAVRPDVYGRDLPGNGKQLAMAKTPNAP